MPDVLPAGGIILVRHGATEWSEAGRHTSLTDLPLLPEGRRQAEALSRVLDPDDFRCVLCSPLLRARQTCELAGFAGRAEIVDELIEWNYGEYEGLTTAQIRERRPDWWLWRDGCPGGEAPGQVCARADHVLGIAAPASADSNGEEPGSPKPEKPAILFAHGHILRALTARWIGLPVTGGSRLVLKPAALGVLGHERETRVIEGWNRSTAGSDGRSPRLFT